MRFYYPKEYKALVKLGVPISIGQIGLTLQNISDNIMVGQHSTEELAAAGFINNLFLLGLLLNVGYSIGAVSEIGSLYPQNKTSQMVSVFKSSIVVDLMQSLLIMGALGVLYFALPYMGQPAELLPLMRPYLVLQILSLPFMAVTGAFRQMTDSINNTSVAMTIMLIGNIWNIVFNWILIFGHCGFPEMGIIGAAWATFSSRVLMFVLYVSYFFIAPRYKKYSQAWQTSPVMRQHMLRLNALGWPIAIQMGMEAASFTLVAILLGWLGTNALAAHQVMISIANIIFMSYIGVASAVAIRVSNYTGINNFKGVRHATFAGYQMILALGIVLSLAAFIFRHDMSMLFTDNKEVASIVAILAYPMVLYQLGDGMQVVFANGLRGMGDVKKLMVYSFLAYVVISLPLSYIMGILLNWGAFGIWMAFPFGLTTAGVLYFIRFNKVTANKLRLTNSSGNQAASTI